MTFGIIALCIGVFLLQRGASSSEEQLEEAFQRVLVYYAEHPYLELDRELLVILFPTTPENQEEVAATLRGYMDDVPLPPRSVRRRQQERLDELVGELLQGFRGQVTFRWGLVPSDFEARSLLTYMFLHAGWMHLLGNLFYLYLTAPFIEDVWGRPVFIVFYLLSGVVAAALYAGQYPHLQGPLIGASGAIAGVMGAFMVRYARTRIEFFYVFWFIRFFVGTFRAPAMIMLLLWVGGELFSAQVADWAAPGSGGGGVAYWAHVWGFGFGALGAVVVGALGIEERHRRRVSVDDLENTVVDQAHQAIAEGRQDAAWELLRTELRQHPSNRDAALVAWDLGITLERSGDAAASFARVVREELNEGETDLALIHWHELRDRVPDYRPDPMLRSKLAETLAAQGERERAAELLREALPELERDLGAGIVLRLFRLAGDLDDELQGEVARAALRGGSLPPDLRLELEAKAGLGRAPVEPGTEPPAFAVPPPPSLDEAGFGGLSEPPRPAPRLRVLEGVPRGFEEDRLLLTMNGGKAARLRLANIRGLSVGAVKEDGAARPFLIIDLFLDPPGAAAEEVRVVRCLSRTFDPRKILPEAAAAGDVRTAFRMLVDRLLAESGATALLDAERFGREQVRIFPTVESYEAALTS